MTGLDLNGRTGVRVVKPAPARTLVLLARGPAGADGTGGSGHSLLSGDGPPRSGPGLEPLDGINDPWRRHIPSGLWVGPAYVVSWGAEAAVPVLPLPPSDLNLYLLLGTRLSVTDFLTDQTGVWVGHIDDVDPNPTCVITASPAYTAPWTTPEGGSGVAALLRTTPDLALDVTTLLGDVDVSEPFEWPADIDGVDTDFWLDEWTGNLYGPKTDGVWDLPHWALTSLQPPV